MEYLNQLLLQLKKKNISIKPSSKKQMEYLVSMVGERKLPQAYIEFMSVMGNGTNGYMAGDSCFMNEIDDLEQGAYDLKSI